MTWRLSGHELSSCRNKRLTCDLPLFHDGCSVIHNTRALYAAMSNRFQNKHRDHLFDRPNTCGWACLTCQHHTWLCVGLRFRLFVDDHLRVAMLHRDQNNSLASSRLVWNQRHAFVRKPEFVGVDRGLWESGASCVELLCVSSALCQRLSVVSASVPLLTCN